MIYLLAPVTTYLCRCFIGQGLALEEKVLGIAELSLDVSFHSIQIGGRRLSIVGVACSKQLRQLE